MASILVQVTTGPENPTKAALAFLLARTALSEGHDVSVFLGGDGVQLIRSETLDSLYGVGTGSLREHFDGIVDGGGKFYLSKMSSGARGVGDSEVEGKPAEMVTPNQLIQLTLDHDRVLFY